MDIYKIIRDLYLEKQRLDLAIASLEQLEQTQDAKPRLVPAPPKRRGRKAMSPEERRIVSQRMKDFWEQRRRQREPIPEPPKTAAAAGS